METKLTNKEKIELKKLQWMKAEQGDTKMLMWLGKQYLGQKDSPTELNVRPISDVVFDKL